LPVGGQRWRAGTLDDWLVAAWQRLLQVAQLIINCCHYREKRQKQFIMVKTVYSGI
jgi:hypothetical protein